MANKPPCPYCDSDDVYELAGGYGLWKCHDCGERFEEGDEDDATPNRIRTKFKSNRYGEDAW